MSSLSQDSVLRFLRTLGSNDTIALIAELNKKYGGAAVIRADNIQFQSMRSLRAAQMSIAREATPKYTASEIRAMLKDAETRGRNLYIWNSTPAPGSGFRIFGARSVRGVVMVKVMNGELIHRMDDNIEER